jgi:hypothetical protein
MFRFFTNGKNFACLLFGATCFFTNLVQIHAQKQRSQIKSSKQSLTSFATPQTKKPMTAVVIEENLAVLRFEPSFSSLPLQRLRNGDTILITSQKSAEGVIFYRAQLSPDKNGWIQADSVAVSTRPGDDRRVLELIRASDGFDKIELASIFLENFPNSLFRPIVLLLFGDLNEEAAERLSREAKRRFETENFRALGAPLYSYYLNFNGLDRYRRLSVDFAFNRTTLQFHYNGASWREIVKKHANSAEAVEAKKRLTSLEAASK